MVHVARQRVVNREQMFEDEKWMRSFYSSRGMDNREELRFSLAWKYLGQRRRSSTGSTKCPVETKREKQVRLELSKFYSS